MSIALKLFIEGLSNGSLFSGTSPQGQSRSDVLSESKIMADSVEIQFVDESEFQNEGIKNSQLELVRTSRKTYFHFRLRLKITLEESTYPSQRP